MNFGVSSKSIFPLAGDVFLDYPASFSIVLTNMDKPEISYSIDVETTGVQGLYPGDIWEIDLKKLDI